MSRWKLSVSTLTAIAVLVLGFAAVSYLDASADLPKRVPSSPGALTPIPVTVSISSCGVGSLRPAAGRQLFVLHNTDYRAADVSLTTTSGAVLGYVESLGPGATANLRVELASGRYTFRCAMEDADVVAGPVFIVPGQTRRGSPAVSPVSQVDLIPATLRYERYVRGLLPRLLRLAQRLRTETRAGSLTAAKEAWLRGHLEYERLGAAYGAFGDADSRINGVPSGQRGVRAKTFTGFHRIEYQLWRGRTGPATVAMTAGLVRSVRTLARTFANARIDPLQVSVRAHEIVENTLQLELTGQTDFGSGSGLATARANIDGTSEVLRLLTPLLRSRYSGLPQLNRAMSRAANDLDQLADHGRWPTITSLTRRERERVNADFSGLSELLAPVASILEPRRS